MALLRLKPPFPLGITVQTTLRREIRWKREPCDHTNGFKKAPQGICRPDGADILFGLGSTDMPRRRRLGLDACECVRQITNRCASLHKRHQQFFCRRIALLHLGRI